MNGVALARPQTQRVADNALNSYSIAVWARLARGALLAAASAWLAAVLPPLRASLLIEAGGAAIGLTVPGVTLVLSPFLIWTSARLFAAGPNLLNPIWYWLFAFTAGLSANALALLFLRDSVASIFVLAAAGFTAIQVAYGITRGLPPWIAAVLFLAVGLSGEWVIEALLHGGWRSGVADLMSLGIFAILIGVRANAFVSIHQALSRPNPKSGVTYAAMHLVTLVEAPNLPPVTEGQRS